MDSIRLAEFVGLPSALGWSHVATVSASSGARSVICFAVSGMQASAIGHEVVAIIRSTQLETGQQLYDLITSLNAKTQESGGSISIAAGFLDEDRGAWITYDGVVGLQRVGRFGRVLSSSNLQMRAGVIQANDIFVLATTSAGGMLDDVAELFLQGYQLAGVESSLERLIRTQPAQDRSAMAIIECLPSDGQSVTTESSQPPLQSLEDVEILDIEKRQNVEGVVLPDSAEAVQSSALEKAQSKASSLVVNDALRNTQGTLTSLRSRQIFAAIAARLITAGKKMATLAQLLKRVGLIIVRATIKGISFVRRMLLVLKRVVQQLPWSAWRKSRRVRSVAVVIGAVLLALIATTAMISWQRRQSTALVAEVLQPFRAQLAAAQQQAVSDPLKAQLALAELTKVVSEKSTSAVPKPVSVALQAFLLEVREYEEVLKGERALRSLPVLMDLQEVVPGFVTTLADGLPGMSLYLDLSKKIAILVQFETKVTRQFDLASIERIQAVSLRSPTEAVILGDGIYALNLETDQPPTLVKPVGDSNRAATLISSYGSYVYIFNPEKHNIYRYLVRPDGYSDPIGWILSPLRVPADSIYSLKIDGDVWLSTKDGQIEKFTSGRSVGFTPSDLELALAGPTQLYTSEADQYLYAFVPTQQRVVVMTKDGIFVKQIKSEVLSGALSVVADESAGLLYAISGSTIYQARL